MKFFDNNLNIRRPFVFPKREIVITAAVNWHTQRRCMYEETGTIKLEIRS